MATIKVLKLQRNAPSVSFCAVISQYAMNCCVPFFFVTLRGHVKCSRGSPLLCRPHFESHGGTLTQTAGFALFECIVVHYSV